MEGAMGLYIEMVIKGLVPDVVTYTALIDGQPSNLQSLGFEIKTPNYYFIKDTND